MKRGYLNYYVIYLHKDDSIVASGTSRECAKALGTTPESFYCLVSRARSGEYKKYEVYIEPFDFPEESFQMALRRYRTGELNMSQAARLCGKSRDWFYYRAKKEKMEAEKP